MPKSVSSLKHCPVCRKQPQKIFDYRGYTYSRCPACGLVSTRPLPTEAEISSHYRKKFKQGNYQLLRRYAPDYLFVYRDMASRLSKYCRSRGILLANAKLLDIGTFTGEFLEAVQAYKCQAWGVELQSEAVRIADQKFPGRILQADVMHHNFSKQSYDIITLLGLIEHVTDPVRLLIRVSQLLKPGGIIMIQTPDSSSLLARLMKQWWPPYSPVEHIHLFSRASLSLALSKCNLDRLDFQRHVKRLPVNYVYQNLQNFGPEFYQLLKPFDKLITHSQIKLPFYGGEMIVFGQKLRS